MEIRLSDEQVLLRDTVRRLARPAPVPGPRGPDAEATDAVWDGLADLGVLGLWQPPAADRGSALAVETVLVVEELAAARSVAPFIGQGVLAPAWARAAGAWAEAEAIAAGTRRATVALHDDLFAFGRPDEPAVAFDASGATGCWSLDAAGVLRHHAALAETATVDLTRATGRGMLSTGAPLGDPIDPATVERLGALALTCLAADLVGSARHAFDLAVTHVVQREQFGRPVGSFQAVQHLLADAAVLVEGARSSAWHAAWAVDALPAPAALLAARQAKAACGRAARTVVETAIQCHGGIAVTWEHPLHLVLRRVLTDDVVLGDVRRQAEAIATARHGSSRVSAPGPTGTASEAGHGLDYRDSPTEAAFRAELRRWLAAEPALTGSAVVSDHDMAAVHDWHRRLAAAGYVGLTFPPEHGGRGLTPLHDAILHDELGAAGAPPAPAINHITHAIRLFGTPDQQQAHLPGMLSCEVRWCQGFSEPGAGSDLAGIATRGTLVATPDGAAYSIRGQKIWTSEARWAQWCLLLLRTEPEPAHRGLSMLCVPMDTPGVEVRPIVTAYGTEEFAEVFFDDAVVPADHLLGRPGQGWEIAMALLGFERGPSDIGWTARLGRVLADLERDVRDGRLAATASQREALAIAWVSLETLRLQVLRTVSARLDGRPPGPEGSIDKLLMTMVDQEVNHVVLDLRGAAAVLDPASAFPGYVWSRAQSIFGGTQQIQRDIVAQRVLGLPRCISG